MRDAETRVETRRRIRANRRGVPEEARQQWSREICERVINTRGFQAAKTIAGFLAFDGEANPIRSMTEAFNAGKRVYVPVIIGKSQPLKFAPWTPTTTLKPNRFGICEPDVAESDWIEPCVLEFVITPLVAFDEACHRIGVGGGYYDRSFAFLLRKSSEAPLATLVGFAFELQKVDQVIANEWDVPLTAVATESRLYQPSPAANAASRLLE